MNAMNKIKKALSLILVFVLVATLLPMPARAADASRTADTIFFATDLHGNASNLKKLLNGLKYTPGLVALGGDYVDNKNSGSLASVTSNIQSVYPGVQTFFTHASGHDVNVSADSSNPYAFARTGEYYEGEDYYVYALDQGSMESASTASTDSKEFKTWAANTAKAGKVIFVLSHKPMHKRRGDNAGGATWLAALNEVAKSRDIVFLWGHNHTGENSSDTSVYYVAPGGTVTPQGGSATTISFTYMNAGYIKNGYATLALINDQNITFMRHNTSGSVTNTYTVSRQFAAHSHSWTVSSSVAATCGTAGSVTYTCSCGETKTETVAATGNHSYTSTSTGATCTQDGSVTYTCTGCGSSYTETVKAGGHTYTEKVTAPTCETAGYTTYTCSVCGYSYVGNETAALGHDYDAVTVEATCTTDGSVTYTCACGDTYTEVIKATGEHVYVESVTKEATCSESGEITYTCGCGYSYTEEIEATGEHVYEVISYEANCVDDGKNIYTCSCGYRYIEKFPATGIHQYVDEVVDPTCEDEGYTIHTCKVCEESYIDAVTEPYGHDYSTTRYEATCEEEGGIVYECECGDVYVEILFPTGHNYVSKVQNGYMVYTCSCGDSYSEKLEMEVTYGKVTKFTAGDAYVITLYSGGKYYALSHANNSISAVRVTVSNNKITSDITEDYLWNYSANKLSYEDDGTTYYLYASSSSTSWMDMWMGKNVTLGVSTSTSSDISFSGTSLRVGSYYLRYSSGKIKADRSAGSTYLFEKTVE